MAWRREALPTDLVRPFKDAPYDVPHGDVELVRYRSAKKVFAFTLITTFLLTGTSLALRFAPHKVGSLLIPDYDKKLEAKAMAQAEHKGTLEAEHKRIEKLKRIATSEIDPRKNSKGQKTVQASADEAAYWREQAIACLAKAKACGFTATAEVVARHLRINPTELLTLSYFESSGGVNRLNKSTYAGGPLQVVPKSFDYLLTQYGPEVLALLQKEDPKTAARLARLLPLIKEVPRADSDRSDIEYDLEAYRAQLGPKGKRLSLANLKAGLEKEINALLYPESGEMAFADLVSVAFAARDYKSFGEGSKDVRKRFCHMYGETGGKTILYHARKNPKRSMGVIAKSLYGTSAARVLKDNKVDGTKPVGKYVEESETTWRLTYNTIEQYREKARAAAELNALFKKKGRPEQLVFSKKANCFVLIKPSPKTPAPKKAFAKNQTPRSG